MEKAHSHNGERVITVGDINARNKGWKRLNNGRGMAVVNLAKKSGYKITPAKESSFLAKGKN